jgi:hypothetical protein
VGGCPPLLGTRRTDSIFAEAPCGQFGLAERVIEAVKTLRPMHVFLLARWSLYMSSKIEVQDGRANAKNILSQPLDRTLDALSELSPVTLFRTAPVIRDDPSRALLRHTPVNVPTADYRRHESLANAAIDAAVRDRANVSTFDPGNLLCTQTCGVQLAGKVLYANATHLSAQGAMLARDEIDDFFRQEVLARTPSQ